MKPDSPTATARQFVRKATRRPARFEVDLDHADQYRLSFPSAQNEVFLTDVSKGGIGLSSSTYIPRNLRAIVHVAGPSGLDMSVKVVARRCNLLDHKPSYFIGMQFINSDGDDERALLASVIDDASDPDTEAPVT